MADAWAAVPSVAGILNAMKKICFMAPSDAQRQEAHAWVHGNFNWDVTFEQYWLPLLERVGRGFGGVHQVVSVGGLTLDLLDADYGDIAKLVAPEATEHYGLDVIPFEPGDVVLDIGAHVGTMSIYLAKRYPGLRILAFEPIRDNYDRLLRNIEANGVGASVTAINLAVTADGRTLTLNADRRNTGSASAYANAGVDGHGWTQMADSTTLADIWADYGLDRVRLLKIDCEGCEYEILQYAGEKLARVDYLSGEFHYNLALTDWEWKPDKLLESCYQFLPAEKVHVTTCRIED